MEASRRNSLLAVFSIAAIAILLLPKCIRMSKDRHALADICMYRPYAYTQDELTKIQKDAARIFLTPEEFQSSLIKQMEGHLMNSIISDAKLKATHVIELKNFGPNPTKEVLRFFEIDYQERQANWQQAIQIEYAALKYWKPGMTAERALAETKLKGVPSRLADGPNFHSN